jgi:hypothetical protein
VSDRLGLNPYAPPGQGEDRADELGDADSSLQRFRYLFPFKTALRKMLTCLGGCAFCVWMAVNYDDGVTFLELLTLSPHTTTRLFFWLALLSGATAFFSIGDVTARFRPPTYLTLDRERLTIPRGRVFRQPVLYRSIKEVSFADARGRATLLLTTKDGPVTLHGNRLDSAEKLRELEAALRSRIRALKANGKPAKQQQRKRAPRRDSERS